MSDRKISEAEAFLRAAAAYLEPPDDEEELEDDDRSDDEGWWDANEDRYMEDWRDRD